MGANAFDTFCEENLDALDGLCKRFADYEPLQGFTNAHLQAWLRQFQAQHRGLAVKLAKATAYYSTTQITSLMPSLKKIVDAQISSEGTPINSVFYAPLGRTGESGTAVLRHYRNVNRLHGLKNQFVSLIELPEIVYRTKPVIFFFDDFLGSGKQVSDGWRDSISQVVPDYIPMYVIVIAAYKDAIDRVSDETPFKVACLHTLGPKNRLMESANTNLSSHEKHTIKRYCEHAGNSPLGFGDDGLLVSFAYGTPNNAISVLRGSEKQSPWRGLLPSWEDLHQTNDSLP